MIKKIFLYFYKKMINFFSDKAKISLQPKSPVDIHYEELAKDCYNHFKEQFKKSYVFSDDDSIRGFAINEAIKKRVDGDLFIEFGVWKALSLNFFAEKLDKSNTLIYGFDSFIGLKDDWISSVFMPKGTFNLDKKLPKVKKNAKLIDGWIENTLPNFLDGKKDKIVFIHFDMDTYNSTAFAIKAMKPFFKKGTIILFDQLHSYPHWRESEFKALNDTLNESEYKFIAFGSRQACIEIL